MIEKDPTSESQLNKDYDKDQCNHKSDEKNKRIQRDEYILTKG